MKLHEEGNFRAALKEAEAYLEEEPEAVDAHVLVADAHVNVSTLARGEERMEHICAALEGYIKSLDMFWNNNISGRMHSLAGQYGMDVDKGEIYGGCGSGGGFERTIMEVTNEGEDEPEGDEEEYEEEDDGRYYE